MALQRDYYSYTASRGWQVIRGKVRDRSRGICERCHLAAMQQVHHLTYRRLGHEKLSDLQGLCRPCHEYVSAKREGDPAARLNGNVLLRGCLQCDKCDCRVAIRCEPWFRPLDGPASKGDIEGLISLVKTHVEYAREKEADPCAMYFTCYAGLYGAPRKECGCCCREASDEAWQRGVNLKKAAQAAQWI